MLQLSLIHQTCELNQSYEVIKSMFNLPYETNQLFLKQYGIEDKHHFYEHIDILKSLHWLKEQWLNVLYSTFYPLSMYLSSCLMLVFFQSQFKGVLNQMSFTFPLEFKIMIGINTVFIITLLLFVLILGWLSLAMFRKVLVIQALRHLPLIKLIFEWHFMVAFNSFKHHHLAINHVISLIKTHQNNALFRILTIDLKEHIERGEGMKQWIEANSQHTNMHGWLYEQISLHHQKNCLLWQKQLENTITLELSKIKRQLLLTLYLLIGFNLMAMMSLLSLPYQWMRSI